MSPLTIRLIISIIFFLHGVGHIMGIIPTLRFQFIENSSQAWLLNWSSKSWLLNNSIGDTDSRIICFILFLIGVLGFAGAAFSIHDKIIPFEYWRMLAIISSVISLLSLFLYWNALILLFPHKIGAIIVNAACLVLLTWIKWPADSDIGY